MLYAEYMDLTSFKDIVQISGPIPEHVLGYAMKKVRDGMFFFLSGQHVLGYIYNTPKFPL